MAVIVLGFQFRIETETELADTGTIWTLNRVAEGTSGSRTASALGYTFASEALNRLFHWTSTGSRTVVMVGTTGVVRT